MIWIPVTLLAAFAQAFRFMVQKQLRMDSLSTGGATFARFLYAAPLICLVAVGYACMRGTGMPMLSASFWVFAGLGGLFQILATMCVVALFQQRNFAVGITFKKTEVILAAAIGLLILGEGVSPLALVAILIGLCGVLILSETPQTSGGWVARVWNKATLLGISSGVFFGACSVFYRAATLNVASDDVFTRSSITLSIVILMQFTGMAVYLRLREPGQITAVVRSWRVAIWVGVLSLAGSLGWFTAFAMQNVAYVKALGQVEIIFSLIISALVFGERLTRREGTGLILLSASVIILVLSL